MSRRRRRGPACADLEQALRRVFDRVRAEFPETAAVEAHFDEDGGVSLRAGFQDDAGGRSAPFLPSGPEAAALRRACDGDPEAGRWAYVSDGGFCALTPEGGRGSGEDGTGWKGGGDGLLWRPSAGVRLPVAPDPILDPDGVLGEAAGAASEGDEILLSDSPAASAQERLEALARCAALHPGLSGLAEQLLEGNGGKVVLRRLSDRGVLISRGTDGKILGAFDALIGT